MTLMGIPQSKATKPKLSFEQNIKPQHYLPDGFWHNRALNYLSCFSTQDLDDAVRLNRDALLRIFSLTHCIEYAKNTKNFKLISEVNNLVGVNENLNFKSISQEQLAYLTEFTLIEIFKANYPNEVITNTSALYRLKEITGDFPYLDVVIKQTSYSAEAKIKYNNK